MARTDRREKFDTITVNNIEAGDGDLNIETEEDKTLVLGDVVRDDLRFALMGQKIDVSNGRIDYDYYNGAIGFQNNARYPNEPISILAQLSHKIKKDSVIKPHIHWLQQGSDEPNWLLAYRKFGNGDSISVVNDYSSHTLTAKEKTVFPYVSGGLAQITTFPDIDTTGLGTSGLIHFVLFRDTNNNSGLFSGNDPSSLKELVFEFDFHYQIDTIGSRQEFIK